MWVEFKLEVGLGRF